MPRALIAMIETITIEVHTQIAAVLAVNSRADGEGQPDDTHDGHPSVETLAVIIEKSALIPFVESYLGTDSMIEFERHGKLYSTILNLVDLLASHPQLCHLLDELPNQVCGFVVSRPICCCLLPLLPLLPDLLGVCCGFCGYSVAKPSGREQGAAANIPVA